MTQPLGGGAWRDPETALMSLVKDATVRIHRPEPGYVPDGSDGDFLGSGFFIAPSWVLTCAHVAMEGRGGQVNVVYKTARGGDAVSVEGAVVVALPEERPRTGGWAAPDLALIRLLRPVEHPCVYLSERSTGMNRGAYYFAGWADGGSGALRRLGRECRVVGTVDDWADGDEQVLIEASQLYAGMSGGPVVDLARGEVVGVLKSRSNDASGGTAIGVERLRTLPVRVRARDTGSGVPPADVESGFPFEDPESDDPYQAVFHAHDRYHADRHNNPVGDEETWSDVQRDLGAGAGPALSPQQRVDLLGRLAELPPPVSTHSLLGVLGGLGYGYRVSGAPAPRGWRDGLGILYDAREGDEALEVILRYCMSVIAAERSHVAPSVKVAEDALWDWVRQTAEGRLSRPFRREMVRLRHHDRHDPEHPYTTDQADDPDRPPPSAPAVLLELEHLGWEPEFCDWRILAHPSGDAEPVIGAGRRVPVRALESLLAAPLAEAFRQRDERDSPAVLQVSVPQSLLGLEVERWQLSPDGRPLGVQRPVVIRCSDARPALSDDEAGERAARWHRTMTTTMLPAVLDCEDGMRVPVPVVEDLRATAYETVPLLCRHGDRTDARSVAGFGRVLDSGIGVVLWRRPRGEPAVFCTEFHRRAGETVTRARTADRLPRALHELRRRVHAGRAETFWSDGVALLLDDPTHPLPGSDDELRAP
ncbi:MULTISPECIES: trypsin-like peptidase domain-containing protein [unclassified Streptomyces]|uniref:VMAP-C domain-containing protein n=1 Tax=unclassified Streptomyces TaxID=2593676 RepID=UPI0036E8835D